MYVATAVLIFDPIIYMSYVHHTCVRNMLEIKYTFIGCIYIYIIFFLRHVYETIQVMNYFLNTLFVSSNIKESIATEAQRVAFTARARKLRTVSKYRGCGKSVAFFSFRDPSTI